MKRKLSFLIFLIMYEGYAFSQAFSLKSVLAYPFPSELTSSGNGSRIAWAMNEAGKRNIYVAEGPNFLPNKITSYNEDDGQEITSLAISDDGQWIVYVRGGDHGGRDGGPVNASSSPIAPKVQIMTIPFTGGKINSIAEGDRPMFSPKNDQIIFIRNGQIMVSPVDGSSPSKTLFYARGTIGSCTWSPDGSKMAFVSSRGDHSFIGIYSDPNTPIQWIEPGFSRDNSPRWSPDGKQLAFVRTPGAGGAPDSILSRKHQPWAIWTAEIASGKGRQIWKAPETLRGSYPSTEGGTNLFWASNRIAFVSYQDGWPHLYSINSDGTNQLLLTPGGYMVEHIKLSNDKKTLLFSANTGKEKTDIDRRHIYSVSVDKADMKALTFGTGIETYPSYTGDKIAYLSATANRPLLPAVTDPQTNTTSLLARNLIPSDFPEKELITPRQVIFKAPDGNLVYGQLFEGKGKSSKKPAIVYAHGGPQRQMVLGWHHMDYYSIDYALNQYLASMGFTVLSVNYRLGTGYGYEFQRPANAGAQGASEYQDIKAAGEWLAKQAGIDKNRIGVYGGSYGGYLVALALGKDSKLFAAGVDIHGVNNRFSRTASEEQEPAPDADLAELKIKESSPVTYLNTWTSATLIIHADDDRNVAFSQSVDLAKRFEDKKFPFEYLAIPDDTHHWMKYSNALKVSEVTADFLKRKLLDK